MKLMLGLACSFLSLSASAAIIRTECDFADYQRINGSLARMPILEGDDLKDEVEALLSQERGPLCVQLLDLTPRPDIPGDDRYTYELTAAGVTYTINIHESMEAPHTGGASITRQ